MCTSFVVKARDGSPLYGRTMEWGGFDLGSELVRVPRGTPFRSALPGHKQGMTWRNELGFVSINAAKLPYATDGMNEAGLVVGVLYLPGFARYQPMVEGKEASTLNAADLAAYLLGRFKRVRDVRTALHELRVVDNDDIAEAFGAPIPIHWIAADESGASLVVEYLEGKLRLYDNKIGVMTNSPGYDWHLLNLRNYPNLRAQDVDEPREIDGVDLAPFGVGSGMIGLPGDFTPPSRFVRAVAYVHTLLPFADAESGLPEVARVLHNFDVPKGLVRRELRDGRILAGHTQWTVVGDLRNRRYYYWTEHNRRMRVVDVGGLKLEGGRPKAIPLDVVRQEDVEDRTPDLA
jgi:choloylglycine hydrolase